MNNFLIGLVLIASGIFFSVKSISCFRKESIIINGEIFTGEKAKKYSKLFIGVSVVLVVVGLIFLIE